MSAVTKLDAWKSAICKNEQGKYHNDLRTVMQVLMVAPELKGKFGFDQFSGTPMALGALPWDAISAPRQIEDADFIMLQEWLQRNEINVRAKTTVIDAVLAVAGRNQYHPLQDYLNALEWDGVPRIDMWLTDYLSAANDRYTRTVARKFLVSAVARGLQAGCQVDTMMVLEGQQGCGKSQSLQALAEPWVLEELSDMKSKDGKLQLRGKWIVEVSELSAMKGSAVEIVKAFISTRIDSIRDPYGRLIKDHPRQCVLVGTTNSDEYLRDETGNRRFLPVKCGTVHLDSLRHDRDQLWAEAVAAYRNNEKWWMDAPEAILATDEQASRLQHDPWQETVDNWLDTTTKSAVTSLDIMQNCLKLDPSQQNQSAGHRVSRTMKLAGWKRTAGRPRQKDESGTTKRVTEWLNPRGNYLTK